MHDRSEAESRRFRMRKIFLSVLLCAVCAAAWMLYAANARVSTQHRFEGAETIDLQQARDAFVKGGENDDLYRLILALCRDASISGDAYDATELIKCGEELYRRAKSGELDLEMIGNTEDTMEVLSLLRELGVTPASS